MLLLAVTEGSDVAELMGALVVLLLIAAGTLALTSRLHLPYTVFLVMIGMGLSALADTGLRVPLLHHLELSPELVLYVFLPALVFESAYNLDVSALRKNLTGVLALAVPGLLLSTVVIGLMVAGIAGVPLTSALLLGAILSATDPVAVVAMFRQLGVAQQLTTLIEGESLFNDATSIVMARLLLGIVLAGSVTGATIAHGVLSFFLVFFGGVLVGTVLGYLAGYLLGKVQTNASIEITLTTVLAYCSFLMAEELLHVSGVMATVAAGLVLGGWGRIKISLRVRGYLEHFWEYAAFVATSLIFLLVGLRIHVWELWVTSGLLACAIAAMLVSRAIVVYGLVPVVNRVSAIQPIDRSYQTVIFWGGLRGAVALAVVLSLPDFPETQAFIAVVVGCVLFTLLVQGLSIRRLVSWLQLDKRPLADQFAELEGHLTAQRQILTRLPEIQAGGLFSGRIAERLRHECERTLAATREEIEALRRQQLDDRHERALLYLRGFAEEKSLYVDMYYKGHLSERVYRELLETLTQQIEVYRLGGSPRRRGLGTSRKVQALLIQMCQRLPGLGRVAQKLRLARFSVDYQLTWARYLAASTVLEHLDDLVQLESTPQEVVEEIRIHYAVQYVDARLELDQFGEQFPEFVTAMQEQLAQRLLLIAEEEALEDEARHGTIPEGVLEEMQQQLEEKLHLLRSPEVAPLRVKPEQLIRKIPFFAEMSAEHFAHLAQQLNPLTIEEKEVVIQQGERGESVYFIARGVVRVSLTAADGTQRDLATLLAGDFFGEMALIEDQPRSATVRAVTPCLLFELKRPDVEAAMQAYPEIRRALESASQARKQHSQQQAAESTGA